MASRKYLPPAVISLGFSLGLLLAQGYKPAEAPKHMTVPGGFQAQLVAGEPMVRQPVCIEFDDRGRLWVVQYLQYPNPAGLKRVKVDRYSRTVYDRLPKPPPRGPKGADRITILDDFDKNGRARRAKDFVGGLNLATGIAFGHGGVFVLQTPYLLFYRDRNGDDVPDGDPDVLLTGFGMEDAHSVANSLTWGPDGWLYGCQGSTVTAHIRGIEFQQGVWRYHPITHQFELFCEGGGNSWGLDFDEHGNLFYSTNYGGVHMLHGVQGGYYWKSFGKHGALHNPYAYGYFEHVPHRNPRGGHVTVGGIIYRGDSFPARFRGKYIASDLLGHNVYWHDLEPWGSTFRSSHGGELLLSNDAWFAPSDVTMGPDGAVYVADWNDSRTAHPDPDAEWNRDT
ncbi:MAG TPA: PVC-type heme-binding CxxCH protein, partial [Gemmataceae bacterium]|nr:PVC-type heme-binding CxxCH protein [Gemmataceae bacterium]